MRSLQVLALTALSLTLACGKAEDRVLKKLSPYQVKSFAEFLKTADVRMASPDNSDNCEAVCTQRRQEFRYVVYIGKQIYCYWDLKKLDTGTDFDALALQLQSSITTSTSFSQYYKILRKWASAFHDGHVNVILKDDLTNIEIFTSPLRVEVLAPATDHEKVIITQVLNGVSDVNVGDQIMTVGGLPISDALTKVAGEASSGSTNRMRRYSAGKRLVDVIGADDGSKPLELQVLDASGKLKNVSLPRTIEVDAPAHAGSPPTTPATGADNYSAKIIPGGWGYFRLDGFAGTSDDAIISQTMERLKATNGLILDLRHNGGGDLSGDRVIERLIDKSVIRYKRSERLSDFILADRPYDNFNLTPDASGLFSIWHDLVVSPLSGHKYQKPVVALISTYCFSACDTFSASLKKNKLATFIGEPTGGGTGTPLVFDLPLSPLSFRYAVIRGEDPDGNWIEGVGTSPDIFLEPTIDDRKANHDSQLLKAIETLQKAIGGNNVHPALENINPTWLQDLKRSPTLEEVESIKRFSQNENVGG